MGCCFLAELKSETGSAFSLWQGMSGKRKLSVLIFAATMLLALSLFINHFSKPEMAVLFRGLNSGSADKILSKLEEMAVPFEISAGGGTIMVPKNRVDELRIRLNSDGGLYGSGIGFELFDQTKLGVTESERRLNYQRALQGELQRTISQIDGVNQSRVHLVLPEPSVFLRETTYPTASIVLQLNPLSQLRKDQVMGIVYLVAGSVENLKAENITVIDTSGRLLTDIGEEGLYAGDGYASATLKQLEVKKAFEKEMEYRVQGMLERVLGAGSVVAMVTADLDFNSEEVTILTYGEPVIRSQQRSEESYEGENPVPAGSTGSDSNIPAYPYAEAPTGGESSYSKTFELMNYEIPETLTRTMKAPGEVRSISASVIYDNRRGTLSPRQAEQIEQLVATAIGFSESRDKISVASINFDTTHLEEAIIAMEETAITDRRNMYIRYGITAFAVIMAFVLVLMIVRSFFSYLESYALYKRQAAAAKAVPVDVESVIPELPKGVRKQKNVREFAQKHPDSVVSLLKIWLAEE
jgi:flagellar M-ring protein FliF